MSIHDGDMFINDILKFSHSILCNLFEHYPSLSYQKQPVQYIADSVVITRGRHWLYHDIIACYAWVMCAYSSPVLCQSNGVAPPYHHVLAPNSQCKFPYGLLEHASEL